MVVLDDEGLGVVALIGAAVSALATVGTVAYQAKMQKKAEKKAKKEAKKAEAEWQAEQKRIQADVEAAEKAAGLGARVAGAGAGIGGMDWTTIALLGAGGLALFAFLRR